MPKPSARHLRFLPFLPFLPILPILMILVLLLPVAGCASLDPRGHAAGVAAQGGLAPALYDGGAYRLQGWERGRDRPGDTLRVYVEGDGRAFVSRTRPSADPTPTDPVALRLAAADPFPKVLYLARPCQFVTGAEAAGCAVEAWTLGRFAPPVIAAVGRALDTAKARFAVSRLELVGYSGGAAVAVLAAAGRNDVAALISVAGVLDSAAWTALHRVSPLTISLEPAGVAPALAHVAQSHLAGADDTIVPPAIPAAFAAASGGRGVAVVPAFDHHCCWVERWPALLTAHPPR